MKTKKEPMGTHWNETEYPKLYQLYRRVETVATALDKRRRSGAVASVELVDELFDIANQLKALDMRVKT